MADLREVISYARRTHVTYPAIANMLHASEVEHGFIFLEDSEISDDISLLDRCIFMDYVSDCVTFDDLVRKLHRPRYLP